MAKDNLRSVGLAIVIGVSVVAAGAAAACGKGDKGGGAAGSGSGSAAGSGSGSAVAAAAPVGVDAVNRFNFPYGKGEAAFKKATTAHKAKDWAAMRSAAEEAIAADPYHHDAHRLRAIALVQLGLLDEARDALLGILPQDPVRLRPLVRADLELAAFRDAPQGKAYEAAAAQIDAAVAAHLAAGTLVLARRGAFKWPTYKAGPSYAASRAEVYSLDLASKRYLRLTDTSHSVAGMLVAPSGREVAVIGYTQVELPDPATRPGDPPILVRAWAQAYDPATWVPTSEKVNVGKGRAAAIAYGAGDQLLVATFAADGRWGLGEAAWSSVDRTTGKAAKTDAPAPDAPRVMVTLDEAWVERPVAGVTAAWSEPTATEPALAAKLDFASGKSIDIPESGKTARDSVAVSPTGARVAFATYTDPCSPNPKRSLYVVDTATGQLKHLLTDLARFRSRWLDDDRLLYEDAGGNLRVYSAGERRELQRITEKGGFGLATLDAHLDPVCRSAAAAPVVTPPAGGSGAAPDDMPPEEPMPPEEGPVTKPK
jgi:hypothetical protein